MSDLPSQSRPPSDESTNEDICTAISMLPDAVLDVIFSFVGPGHYRYIAGTNRHFRRVHNNGNNREKKTFWSNAAASVECAKLVLNDLKLLEKRENYVRRAKRNISVMAAKDGNIVFLEWARQNDFALSGLHFRIAAENGHVNVFEWGKNVKLTWNTKQVPISASENGKVNILDWLFLNLGGRFMRVYRQGIWYQAARRGQVSVLDWLKDHNWLPLVGIHDWLVASQSGHRNVLDWIFENVSQQAPYNAIVEEAVSRGHVHILEWARSHGCTFTCGNCAVAAFYGYFVMLQWLREKECPWDSMVLAHAQRNGHQDIIDWARANGCPEL